MKQSLTKKQLSIIYGVSYSTFLKWIKNIPELKLDPKQRLLTPKQIDIIYESLG